MKPINSLQDFKPLPRAKVLEVQSYIKDAAPPPSPRVKDRYAARMAERARRKRERMQRLEEWPGWVPDEKVLLSQQLQKEEHERRVRIDVVVAAKAGAYDDEAASFASRERWLHPRTWRRRVWGIVTTLGLLALVAVIVVATTISQDNAPGVKTPLSVRLVPRLAETSLEVEAAVFAPPSSPGQVSSSLRSPISDSPAARRMARRLRRRRHR
ncbi:hypothetical protein N0V82_010902 [Gnomoniopsis sp. IMI 355080]|nr:hypothetical protein N0V82_010902 [Gnomoniopsis sp. IMI 355080]